MPACTPHYLLFSESHASLGQSAPVEAGAAARRHGRWRFVLESVDGSTQFSAADEEREVAADRLDLLAVIRGLEALDQPSRVTLVTPSRYVTRGIRFGLEAWRQNDWRWESFGEMERVPNADLWQRVDRALQIHDVRCRAWRASSPEPGTSGASAAAASTVAPGEADMELALPLPQSGAGRVGSDEEPGRPELEPEKTRQVAKPPVQPPQRNSPWPELVWLLAERLRGLWARPAWRIHAGCP